MQGYKTVEKMNVWEQVIEKSRFIGVIVPVNSTEDGEQVLKNVRVDYPNATHYVYAWRIQNGKLEKSSDDGEPQGTGGKPVLELLQHKELWNVILVVIRYFGGTLLGTGGLVRAYGGTARQLVEQTEIKALHPFIKLGIRLDYAMYEKVKYQLKQKKWSIGQEEFGQAIDLETFVPEEEKGDFYQALDEWTGGKALIHSEQVVLRAF